MKNLLGKQKTGIKLFKSKFMMKLFFKKTYYFWIVSRLLLIVLYTCTINFRNNPNYGIGNICVNILIIVMILLMVTLFLFDLLEKHAPKIIQLIPGIFNILFGSLLFYLVLQFISTGFELLIQLIPIWIILYGIFEITNNKKTIA